MEGPQTPAAMTACSAVALRPWQPHSLISVSRGSLVPQTCPGASSFGDPGESVNQNQFSLLRKKAGVEPDNLWPLPVLKCSDY